MPVKTVAIVGAGPVGLAAAAHVMERGMTPLVLETGPEAGHAVQQWGHVQLFSPWQYNIDAAARRLLAATGWNSPDPSHYPTGRQLLEQYLRPLATNTALTEHIQTSARVTAISRLGFDKVRSKGRSSAPFGVRYEIGSEMRTVQADAVIDASGTWFTPNPAGANGLEAIGEREVSGKVSYGMPDILGVQRQRFGGKTVAVLGSGHSSVGTLTALVELKRQFPQTRVIWLLRGSDPAKSFGGGANDKLAARGELGSAFAALVANGSIEVEAAFHTSHLHLDNGRLRVSAGSVCCGRHLDIDELIVATGFRPNLGFVRELRIQLDPAIECPTALAPLIDPNEHSCGTVRPHGARELEQADRGFYFAGMKSYGRAPTFLMLTGYEQARSIAAHIAGDFEAANRVELVLPETGVCTRNATATTCCSSPISETTCCVSGSPTPAKKSSCGCS